MQDMSFDISKLSAQHLLDLIAAANVRLEQLRQEHIAAGEALGLSLSNGKPRSKRRASKHHDTN